MNSRGWATKEPTPGNQSRDQLPRRGRPMPGTSTLPALANPSGVHLVAVAHRGFRVAPPPAIHGGPLRGPRYTVLTPRLLRAHSLTRAGWSQVERNGLTCLTSLTGHTPAERFPHE